MVERLVRRRGHVVSSHDSSLSVSALASSAGNRTNAGSVERSQKDRRAAYSRRPVRIQGRSGRPDHRDPSRSAVPYFSRCRKEPYLLYRRRNAGNKCNSISIDDLLSNLSCWLGQVSCQNERQIRLCCRSVIARLFGSPFTHQRVIGREAAVSISASGEPAPRKCGWVFNESQIPFWHRASAAPIDTLCAADQIRLFARSLRAPSAGNFAPPNKSHVAKSASLRGGWVQPEEPYQRTLSIVVLVRIVRLKPTNLCSSTSFEYGTGSRNAQMLMGLSVRDCHFQSGISRT